MKFFLEKNAARRFNLIKTFIGNKLFLTSILNISRTSTHKMQLFFLNVQFDSAAVSELIKILVSIFGKFARRLKKGAQHGKPHPMHCFRRGRR